MNPYHHSLSSARKYGGEPEDYLELHQWFDASKALFPDFRHRALRHHTEGIFLAETIFGPFIESSAGRKVPTRFLGEQHVQEDLGRIPTVQDWLVCLRPVAWMMRVGLTSAELEGECAEQKSAQFSGLRPASLCECELPGAFHTGVPGILARLESGRLAPGAKVERCDACRRYPSDEAARQKLAELGIG